MMILEYIKEKFDYRYILLLVWVYIAFLFNQNQFISKIYFIYSYLDGVNNLPMPWGGWPDPSYYLSLSLKFPNFSSSELNSYFIERVPVLLPQIIFYNYFDFKIADILLKFILIGVNLSLFYSIIKNFFCDKFTSFLCSLIFISYPYTLYELTNNYVNGYVYLYTLLSIRVILTSFRCNFFLSGFFITLAILSTLAAWPFIFLPPFITLCFKRPINFKLIFYYLLGLFLSFIVVQIVYSLLFQHSFLLSNTLHYLKLPETKMMGNFKYMTSALDNQFLSNIQFTIFPYTILFTAATLILFTFKQRFFSIDNRFYLFSIVTFFISFLYLLKRPFYFFDFTHLDALLILFFFFLAFQININKNILFKFRFIVYLCLLLTLYLSRFNYYYDGFYIYLLLLIFLIILSLYSLNTSYLSLIYVVLIPILSFNPYNIINSSTINMPAVVQELAEICKVRNSFFNVDFNYNPLIFYRSIDASPYDMSSYIHLVSICNTEAQAPNYHKYHEYYINSSPVQKSQLENFRSYFLFLNSQSSNECDIKFFESKMVYNGKYYSLIKCSIK